MTAKRRLSAAMIVIAVLASSLAAAVSAPSQAADGDLFDPGHIISDEVFYDKDAMTRAEVQSFLAAKGGNCTSGYTCIDDFTIRTSAKPVNDYCDGYVVATQNVAQIITGVAQSCGISPKVLLVTLQKETSLVTRSNPTAHLYKRAMGYGCPDSNLPASSDSNQDGCYDWAEGFFQQIYHMAQQFKIYQARPTSYGHIAGRTQWIDYHPNDSCGSTQVYIQNQATAGLYNYTPYVPNKAALDAGYGSGNACSSYGNRNFFFLFTDWFGSTFTDLDKAFNEKHASLGGSTGVLGSATGPRVSDGTRQYREYQRGRITWTRATGPLASWGEIWDRHQEQGGTAVLGWPIADTVESRVKGSGTMQQFENGTIYASNTHGAYLVTDTILETYWNRLSYRSDLGWPIHEVVNSRVKGSGEMQQFEGGVIYASWNYGPYVVTGDILDTYWGMLSYRSDLGWPISKVVNSRVKGSGEMQQFEGGVIYASHVHGTHVVTGPILEAYWGMLSYRSALGWPTSDTVHHADAEVPFWIQSFEGGTLIWSERHGTAVLAAGAAQSFFDAGGAAGLGWPTSTVVNSRVRGGGTMQQFQNGVLYVSNDHGAHVVTHDILDTYWGMLSYRSYLGWPTGPATVEATGLAQEFENGEIVWSPTGGSRVVAGAIRHHWDALGRAPGGLGWPVDELVTSFVKGGGTMQRFEHGVIYAANELGPVAVTGPILDTYWGMLSYRSDLGWPVAAATSAGDTRAQMFQYGAIVSHPDHGVVVMPRGTADAYLAGGGADGLGWPVAELVESRVKGGGTMLRLEAGVLYDSNVHGSYAVSGTILERYWGMLSYRSELGWPTGPATTQAGTTTQRFEGGVITATPEGTVVSLR